MNPPAVSSYRTPAGNHSSALQATVPAMARTSCPDCGLANVPERKYCAGCGRSLWEPCLSCGAYNAAAEAFCGQCGSNLVQLVQEHAGQLQALVERAESLQSSHEYHEAIDLLSGVSNSEHTRLARLVQQCRQLAKRSQDELERLESNRNKLLCAAQEHFAGHRYEEAAAALKQIHAAVRTPPVTSLLEQVQQVLKELSSLKNEIRAAVEERRTNGLLPKLERYLELKPGDASLEALRNRLRLAQQRRNETRRNQLMARAKQKFAEHDYAAAANLLDQIAAAVSTPEVEALRQQCDDCLKEIGWLVEDLQQVAMVDRELLPLTQRLQKLCPADPQITHLIQRSRQLHALLPSDQACRWFPSHGPSSLGWPIDVLDGFQRINAAPVMSCPAYREEQTSFYVACGLALAGLEQAILPIDLTPKPKKGLLTGLTGPLRKRRRWAWGIDVGAGALKAVKLGFEPGNDAAPTILVCEHIAYDRLPTAGNATPNELVRLALTQLLEQHTLQGECLCVSFPAAKTLFRSFALPPTGKKLDEIIRYEARRQIPFALETVVWDCFVAADGAQDDRPREANLFALRAGDAQQHLWPFEELGLNVRLVQPDAVALKNFVAFELLSATANTTGALHSRLPIALLDIGHSGTRLLVTDGQSFWLRNLPFGSRDVNKALANRFRLTHQLAEQLKRRPSTARWVHKLNDAWQPLLQEMFVELQRSVASFEQAHRGRTISRMLVTGGGIRLHGLLRSLRNGCRNGNSRAIE